MYCATDETRKIVQAGAQTTKDSKIRSSYKEYRKCNKNIFDDVPLTDKELKSMILSPQMGANK